MTLPTGQIRTIDYHTGGEPLRIVVDGGPAIEGATAAERRSRARDTEDIDVYRQLLCREPRGHADMYGCFVFPPDTADADFSVVFWHNEGYPPSCGHGTLALAAWAVEHGVVESKPDGLTTVTIDVPAGRALAQVRQRAGIITGVQLDKGPAHPVATSIEVETSFGHVTYDLSFCGALYASVDATALGLSVTPEHYGRLVAFGRELRATLNDVEMEHHSEDDRLDGVFGVVLFEDLGATTTGPHERIMNVFNDGWVDRSPGGSSTGARLALLAASGRLGADEVLTSESIVGSRFVARAHSLSGVDAAGTIGVEIEGLAHKTGEHVFSLAASDSLGTGFVLR
jgi:proline racemase